MINIYIYIDIDTNTYIYIYIYISKYNFVSHIFQQMMKTKFKICSHIEIFAPNLIEILKITTYSINIPKTSNCICKISLSKNQYFSRIRRSTTSLFGLFLW